MRFELGLGQRQIARSCGMGLGTVHDYLKGWSEEELEAKLFGSQPVPTQTASQRPQPDWKHIHAQLQQHRHLTLQLVWEESRREDVRGLGGSNDPGL